MSSQTPPASDATPIRPRRRGAETRALIQSTAVRLFIEQGYDATSLRQIAEQLGINKASLFYYFDSKQAILDAAFDTRDDETQQLLAWLAEQPRTPGLLVAAVMRWVETYSVEKLRGIRFMAANPHLRRGEAGGGVVGEAGGGVVEGLLAVADELTALLPDPSPENAVLVRMALLSINAAVNAARHSSYPDEVIVGAAVRGARALLADLDGTWLRSETVEFD